MDNKTLSIISYVTLIGWLVAYFSGKDKADSLLKYHLKQSFGLMIVSIVINILMNVVVIAVPSIYYLSYIVSIFILVLIVMGIMNASNQVEKPLPIIGKMFENKFGFIK